MPITHLISGHSGAPLGYHKPHQYVVNLELNLATVQINSYFNERAALDGLPIAQQWRMDIPAQLLAGGGASVSAEVENALTTHPESKLYGGIVVTNRALTIDELKDRKRAEITRQRLAADGDHFEFQGKQIRTADKDMLDLLVADARWRKGKPANWPGGWKAIDDTYVRIDLVEEWDAFFVAMYDTGIDNFMHSQALKAALEAATTPSEIQAITW